MKHFYFTVPYTDKGFCKMIVEAETEAEARELITEGEYQDMYDSDIEETTYDGESAELYDTQEAE